MSRFIIRITNYFFFAFIALFLFANIFWFSFSFIGGFWGYVLIAFMLVGVLIFFCFGERIFTKVRLVFSFLDKMSSLQMMALLFVFIVLTKVILVFALGTELNGRGDMPAYVSFAKQLANDGMITDDTFYANMYKYTVVFSMFLSPVVKIFGGSIKVILVFVSILYAVITVVLFDIIRPYAGRKKSFLGLLLFNVFPVGLFISQVVIHETALLFFYVISFWLLLKAMNTKFHIALRALSLVLSAVLISFGAAINEGGKVVIIAYLIFALVYLFKDKISVKKIGKYIFTVLCYVICLLVITNACVAFVSSHIRFSSDAEKSYSENAVSNRLWYSWKLFTGSNTESNGGFDGNDFKIYSEFYNIQNKEDAEEYQKTIVKDRLEYFWNNPLQIPRHLFLKFVWFYGKPFVTIEYSINTNLREWSNNLSGYPLLVLGALGNLYSIIIASMILFSYKKHKKDNIKNYINSGLQLKLFIVGLTLALILFETSNKYVSHTQILLTCIAILSINSFISNSNGLKNRVKQISRKKD